MKKARLPNCGTVFLVPLRNGGYGIGVLVRADGKGRAFGSFFGPRIASSDEISNFDLQMKNAIFSCRFGDHGLYKKSWNVVGAVPDWNPEQWPMPKFSRQHDDASRYYVTEYDDNLGVLSETIVPASEALNLPEDVQFGSGIIEIKLDNLLASSFDKKN